MSVRDEYENVGFEDSELPLSSDVNDSRFWSPARKRYLLFAAMAGIVVAVIGVVTILILVAISRNTVSEDDSDNNYTPTVILISLDGYRRSYLDQYSTQSPRLQAIGKAGIFGAGLIPSFPTKTFPNHYTVVTGLYPEAHGIIGNTIYDPVFNATFTISNPAAVTDPRWWGGEPLWVTAIKQGQKAACYFWPGSEAPIEGVLPTYYMKYNGAIPNSDRVAQVLAWLDKPESERPTFLTLYMEIVDSMGHSYGPDSEQVSDAISQIDTALGQLMDGLATRNLLTSVNVIVVADHGMTAVSEARDINVKQYFHNFTTDQYAITTYSPVLNVRVTDDADIDGIFNALEHAHPNLTAYRREDIPERLHYTHNRRIPPVVGIADLGWSLSTGSLYGLKGDHGYDYLYEDMHAIFMAQGPAFKRQQAPPIKNIDLYELMAKILKLTPAPNNGSLADVSYLLR